MANWRHWLFNSRAGVCVVLPSLVCVFIGLLELSGLWELIAGSVLVGTGEQTLVWPIVWIYGFFVAFYGLLIATRRNEINQQGQITERYTKISEQLAHGEKIVREAGYLALESWASETTRDERERQARELVINLLFKYGEAAENLERVALRSGKVDLQGMGLRGVRFRPDFLQKFVGATLTDAKLDNANLTDANLTRANLDDADITNANFTNTNLANVRNLTQAQLDTVIYETGKPPKNLPEDLKLREEERVDEINEGITYRVLPPEKWTGPGENAWMAR